MLPKYQGRKLQAGQTTNGQWQRRCTRVKESKDILLVRALTIRNYVARYKLLSVALGW